jgi:ankyrin repeat protein
MQLTKTSMDADSNVLDSIPEVNDQEEEEEADDDKQSPLATPSSSLKTNRLHSPSPTPHPSASTPPDRALNQKFHIAALTGNLSILQELFTQAHLPIDCRDKENSTALLLSCARGHYSCAEYLLANGADPNARRITGASPLYFAASYHHTRIVELLLNKYKAIVDLSTFDGSTPLHVACEHGFTDIVQLLIHSQVNINAKMNDGTTAIMLACQNGYLSIVQMLISTGQCNVSIQRLDGVTSLFLIVQHGHEPIFDYFIENTENIKDLIDLAREDGATPLFKACQKGYDSLVNKLLKYKPNLEILRNGESVSKIILNNFINLFLFSQCLHAATMFNHSSIVRSLLDHGSNPLLNNWEGMTPVDLAKEAQIKDILDILMKYLSEKLSEHARKYLLHKSTRRSDADFDLELVKNPERDEWKLYKSLKSADGLERLEEEIEHIPILPDLSKTKTMRQKITHRPHRYSATSLS